VTEPTSHQEIICIYIKEKLRRQLKETAVYLLGSREFSSAGQDNRAVTVQPTGYPRWPGRTRHQLLSKTYQKDTHQLHCSSIPSTSKSSA